MGNAGHWWTLMVNAGTWYILLIHIDTCFLQCLLESVGWDNQQNCMPKALQGCLQSGLSSQRSRCESLRLHPTKPYQTNIQRLWPPSSLSIFIYFHSIDEAQSASFASFTSVSKSRFLSMRSIRLITSPWIAIKRWGATDALPHEISWSSFMPALTKKAPHKTKEGKFQTSKKCKESTKELILSGWVAQLVQNLVEMLQMSLNARACNSQSARSPAKLWKIVERYWPNLLLVTQKPNIRTNNKAMWYLVA